jgi:hypothetical protein
MRGGGATRDAEKTFVHGAIFAHPASITFKPLIGHEK